MKRLIATFSIVIFTTVLFGSDGARGEKANKEYVKEEIFFCPWGNEENMIKLREEKKVLKLGMKYKEVINRTIPGGFGIDNEGNIFISDMVSMRIKKFNKKGKFIKLIESNFGYLKFVVNETNGELHIINNKENTVITVNKNFKRKKKKIKENAIKKMMFKRHYELKHLNKIPHYEHFKGKNVWEYEFMNLKSIGANCDSKVYVSQFPFGSMTPLGIDRLKNIYYLVEKVPEVEDYLFYYFVLKFDISNCKFDLIEMEIDYFSQGHGTYPITDFKVDREGNIYQMLTTKKGVHIIKWEKR